MRRDLRTARPKEVGLATAGLDAIDAGRVRKTRSPDINTVPDDVLQRLGERARLHHRSLKNEVIAILEATLCDNRPTAPTDILADVRRLGLDTRSEAARIVRGDRDAR